MRTFLVLAATLLVASSVSAQTVTIAEETGGSVKKIHVTWTSDASGDASGSTSGSFNGRVLALVTDPDDGSAPSDNYDIVLTDAEGLDVLAGAGANRDTANTEQVTDEASLGVVANDVLTFTVSNAGNATSGEAFIYIR